MSTIRLMEIHVAAIARATGQPAERVSGHTPREPAVPVRATHRLPASSRLRRRLVAGLRVGWRGLSGVVARVAQVSQHVAQRPRRTAAQRRLKPGASHPVMGCDS